MRRPIILMILLLPALSVGQTAAFRWDTELCKFSGTYNPRKYTKEQLRNTVRLMRPGEFGLDTTNATVWKFDEIAALDVAALEKKYESTIAELKALKIVPSPYWEGVRQSKIREIEEAYPLARATMLAYTRLQVLGDYPSASSCKVKFAEPLIAGGDRLLAAWQAVNENSRKNNADPQRIRRIFDQQMASPGRLRFARVEVMSFGWWNCANQFVQYDQGDNGPAREREFRKLFIRVRNLGCDEP